jgi:hypothetical protein
MSFRGSDENMTEALICDTDVQRARDLMRKERGPPPGGPQGNIIRLPSTGPDEKGRGG